MVCNFSPIYGMQTLIVFCAASAPLNFVYCYSHNFIIRVILRRSSRSSTIFYSWICYPLEVLSSVSKTRSEKPRAKADLSPFISVDERCLSACMKDGTNWLKSHRTGAFPPSSTFEVNFSVKDTSLNLKSAGLWHSLMKSRGPGGEQMFQDGPAR